MLENSWQTDDGIRLISDIQRIQNGWLVTTAICTVCGWHLPETKWNKYFIRCFSLILSFIFLCADCNASSSMLETIATLSVKPFGVTTLMATERNIIVQRKDVFSALAPACRMHLACRGLVTSHQSVRTTIFSQLFTYFCTSQSVNKLEILLSYIRYSTMKLILSLQM